MDSSNKITLVWAVAGLLIFITLYNSYKSPDDENGDNGGGNGNPDTVTLKTDVQGPGYLEVVIGGENQGAVKDTTYEVDYGTAVSINAAPEQGARLVNLSNDGFTITKDLTVTASFVDDSGGAGEYPYGLTEEQYMVCRDKVQKWFENPDTQPYTPPVWRRGRVVFGFKGWANDAQLELNNKSNNEYLQDVADILMTGAPDPIMDAHMEFGGLIHAPVKSKSEIISQIEGSGG